MIWDMEEEIMGRTESSIMIILLIYIAIFVGAFLVGSGGRKPDASHIRDFTAPEDSDIR